jgi:hypothetical protein
MALEARLCELNCLRDRFKALGMAADEAMTDALHWFYLHPESSLSSNSVFQKCLKRILELRPISKSRTGDAENATNTASFIKRF